MAAAMLAFMPLLGMPKMLVSVVAMIPPDDGQAT
jgi:hypothetical protein